MPQALTLFGSNLSLVIRLKTGKRLLLLTDSRTQHYVIEKSSWGVEVASICKFILF